MNAKRYVLAALACVAMFSAAPGAYSQVAYTDATPDGSRITVAVTPSKPLPTSLAAGSAVVGKVGIDQTTPGTTNGVVVNSSALPTGAATAANQSTPLTPVSAGAATATTSQLAGCRYVATLDSYANTNQGGMTCGSRGSLRIQIMDADSTAGIVSTIPASGVANTRGLNVVTFGELFSGATWDQEFTCPSTASVNVTAGSTTQIVGLSASTVIRVCSVSISMSAAGTAAFVTGTGTNCGTPSAIMTAMTLATGTPWAQSAPAGGSLFRSTAGGEICVTAATGNVTGLITYAQF